MFKLLIHIVMSMAIIMVIFSCSSNKPLSKVSVEEIPPPGTALFSENLFLDETEITNLSWREYLFWQAKTHGKKSNEYLTSLPDTNVWLNVDSCLWDFREIYLRHPAYSDHPVVGVSQKQAREFTEWRSDRVMEYVLIKDGRMSYEANRPPNELFTIERYLTDSLDYITEDKKLSHYPEYRLPNLSERELILENLDSIARTTHKLTKNDLRSWNETYHNLVWADIPSCDGSEFMLDPLKRAYGGSYHGLFNNLRGNVSEYVEEDSISVGGGWIDSRVRIFQTDTFHVAKPNAWTGFRNVCEWKKREIY